jgi:UDP-N-acetyl-alpha-D-quinovosamine dehydrogenase
MTRVLVTGGTGFVGRMLCGVLAQSDYVVRAALRGDRAWPDFISEKTLVGDITSTTDWSSALDGVDAVIHAAARVHVLHDTAASEDLYAEVNERGTMRLASAAAQAGVRRFIFLSSVKVNGEETTGRAYSATNEPHPCDAYGRSKWRGEKCLQEIGATTSMEAVIVRPPLVYGPGVKANFLRLLRWVDKERPLPLGAIDNSRSLVSVWNLCDLLAHLLKHSAAPGRTWMVSDGEDVSTPDLIRRIAHAMGRRARLLRVPASLLRLLGGLAGQGAEVARLCSSLQVDLTRTREELGWSPPVTVDEALARTVEWYLRETKSGRS